MRLFKEMHNLFCNLCSLSLNMECMLKQTTNFSTLFASVWVFDVHPRCSSSMIEMSFTRGCRKNTKSIERYDGFSDPRINAFSELICHLGDAQTHLVPVLLFRYICGRSLVFRSRFVYHLIKNPMEWRLPPAFARDNPWA